MKRQQTHAVGQTTRDANGLPLMRGVSVPGQVIFVSADEAPGFLDTIFPRESDVEN